MNLDKQVIKEKISDILIAGTAATFAIGDFFVQAAAKEKNKIYAEAVSHHFHEGLNIGLEAGFAAMGYHLEEGGNYSKVYTVNTGHDIDIITGEFETIFRDFYRADPSAAFEVTDIE